MTATAKVKKIVWKMGDGTSVSCMGAGTPYKDSFGKKSSPTCGHTYTRQGRYTVTATSYWVVAWAGIGQAGTIPLTLSESANITMGGVSSHHSLMREPQPSPKTVQPKSKASTSLTPFTDHYQDNVDLLVSGDRIGPVTSNVRRAVLLRLSGGTARFGRPYLVGSIHQLSVPSPDRRWPLRLSRSYRRSTCSMHGVKRTQRPSADCSSTLCPTRLA